MPETLQSQLIPSSGDDDSALLGCRYRICRLAAGGRPAEEAVPLVLHEIVSVLHANSGMIALVNPDHGALDTETTLGWASPPPTRIALGESLAGWVAFYGKPLLVRKPWPDPRQQPLHPKEICAMAVPLRFGDQLLGVLELGWHTCTTLSEKDLTLLDTLGQEATAILHQLWELSHLRRKAQQLEGLISIGRKIVTKFEIQDLLESIARETQEISGYPLCTIQLIDRESSHLELRAAYPHSEEDYPIGSSWPLVESMAGSAVQTRKTVEYINIRSADFHDLQDLPRRDQLVSMICNPLIWEGEILGVLNVFTDRQHRFANDERRLLGAMAGLAASAIQNSRLYSRIFASEETLRKNERLTTLGLLAAEIAHEIRNPLTVIKLLFGALDLRFAPEDPRHKDNEIIREKLDHLEAIVSKVLSFSKAPDSLYSHWNLDEIIQDTCLLIRLKLRQNKVRLSYFSAPRPVFVEGNKGQLQQVLLNLLLNAMEAMPDGGTISIRVQKAGNAHHELVEVRIEDTGHGIPHPLHSGIFESFLSHRNGGTGLGLSIVKRLLQAHHGDIELERSDQEGTVMRFWLPVVHP